MDEQAIPQVLHMGPDRLSVWWCRCEMGMHKGSSWFISTVLMDGNCSGFKGCLFGAGRWLGRNSRKAGHLLGKTNGVEYRC
jgi:hypothetical protein